jgi:uncharacterized protein YutE (UPF0331/DUF86 family)
MKNDNASWIKLRKVGLFMVYDVILNKVAIIERCIQRIQEVYANDLDNLEDYTKQDSIVLNIQRACEATIGLAMHLISIRQWGIPQKSREAFELLHTNRVIDEHVMKKMQAMVGFRNIAVHDYQTLKLEVLEGIVKHHLGDFQQFTQAIILYFNHKK